MKSLIAEWLWRAAVICALGWIGWELHLVHEEMLAPADEDTTVTASADDISRGIEDVRDDVASLSEKVDAIMTAMTRAR